MESKLSTIGFTCVNGLMKKGSDVNVVESKTACKNGID